MDLIRLERTAAVATISLARPDKLNALNDAMIAGLVDAIEEVRADHTVRAVILRGDGRAFCSGDDILRAGRHARGHPDLQTRKHASYPRVVLDLLELRKPVVGAIHGYAIGAGFDIALACDFRIAAEGTQLGATFVQRGLGGGGAYLLPRYVGFGRATEMLLLGEMFDARRALELGLLTSVVAAADLGRSATELAERLARGPTAAYGAIKNARDQGLGADPVKGLEWQMVANAELLLHKDAYEGPRAFKEKRDPVFTGEWIDLPDEKDGG